MAIRPRPIVSVFQSVSVSGDMNTQVKDDRFVGRLKPGAYRFDSDSFGQKIILEETLTLMEDQIWFADRGLSLSSNYLFGMRGDTPNISLKVRPFICENRQRSAWLHDQGGETQALGYRIKSQRFSNTDKVWQPAGLRLTVPISGRRDLTVLANRDAETVAVDVGPDQLIFRHAPETLYSEDR